MAPLQVRTGDFAKRSSGSAAAIFQIAARAGRRCAKAQCGDCYRELAAKQTEGFVTPVPKQRGTAHGQSHYPQKWEK